MKIDRALFSALDESVNFVHKDENGILEARYVRRADDYFVCYLSTQYGCELACRFCHLTQTGQTSTKHAGVMDVLKQADTVLQYYKSTNKPAERVNFNFMARGDFLNNPILMDEFEWLKQELLHLSRFYGINQVHVNISTIVPKNIKIEDFSSFKPNDLEGLKTNIYYSLYSVMPHFKRKWIPNRLFWAEALGILDQLKREKRIDNIIIHSCFIEGENDDLLDVKYMCNAIQGQGYRFNLVRYNPYSEKQGKETSEENLQRIFKGISQALGEENCKIVTRVGEDIYASCGQFITSEDS